jgi:hypothetical protein
MTAVTRLDRDRAAGVNRAWNSRHRCRDRRPGHLRWFRHTSCLAVFRRLGPLTSNPPVSLSVTKRTGACVYLFR